MKFQSDNTLMRNDKKIGEDMENTKKSKKLNPILLFLFAVVIPLFAVLTLTVIILALAGVNVSDWAAEKASNIPIVSNVVKTKDEKIVADRLKSSTETVEKQKKELSKLTEEVTSLKLARDELESLLQKQNAKMEQLENREDPPDKELDEAEEVDDDTAIASFRKMEPTNAAAIMEKTSDESAAIILGQLSGKVRGAILAEMDPEKAATLTELMLNK